MATKMRFASSRLLPDTFIAAIANEDSIFTYTQLYSGQLAESIYDNDKLVWKARGIGCTNWDNVKLFTPLAAVFWDGGKTRYLFYIDKENILNNLIYINGKWSLGDLGSQGIKPALYSKLAAVALETIYVFYQTSDKEGHIRQVCGWERNWKPDNRDFGDPPLFGTSLAAVIPEPGLIIHSPADDNIPVVFFQNHNLKLAELQANDLRELKPITPNASPHTPLAAVDDGNAAYLFYTTDENMIRRIEIRSDETQIGPLNLNQTTPKGNIAAVIWHGMVTGSEEIIVIYQPWYDNIFVDTITRPSILAIARYKFTGSGKSKTLSEPVISHCTLEIE